MNIFSKESQLNSDKNAGIKAILGDELSGTAETLPTTISIPHDLLRLASSLCDNDPLKEKSALIDYVSDINSFIPRQILKGETYSPGKKSTSSTTIWGNVLTTQSRALKGEPLIEIHNHPDIAQIGDHYNWNGVRLPDSFTKLSLRLPSSTDMFHYLSIAHGLMEIVVSNYGGSIIVPWSKSVRSRKPFGIVNFSDTSVEKSIGSKTYPVMSEGIKRFGHNQEQLDYFIRTTLQMVTYSAYAEILKKYECSIYFTDDIKEPFTLVK